MSAAAESGRACESLKRKKTLPLCWLTARGTTAAFVFPPRVRDNGVQPRRIPLLMAGGASPTGAALDACVS